MKKDTPKSADGMLPKGFKTVVGIILLTISIGLLSLQGMFA